MGEFVSLETLVEGVRDGMSLAVPTDYAGVAMAATAAIIARRPKNLHLVCVPISGIQADMLIGEGLVGAVETSSCETGPAWRGVVHEDGDRVGVRMPGREGPGNIIPVRAGDGRQERQEDVLGSVRAAPKSSGRTGRCRQREPHGVGLESPRWQVERDPLDDPPGRVPVNAHQAT